MSLPRVGDMFEVPHTGPANVDGLSDFVETRMNGDLEGQTILVQAVDPVPNWSVLYEGHTKPEEGKVLYEIRGVINEGTVNQSNAIVVVQEEA